MDARRAAGGMPGEHPALGARQEEEEEREEAAQAGAAAPQEPHLAAVLFPAHHVGRAGRQVQVLLAAGVRAQDLVRQAALAVRWWTWRSRGLHFD